MFFRLKRAGIDLLNPKKILFFLWLFILVFPKGGFKISDIPITWGYLLLGITTIFLLCQPIQKMNRTRILSLYFLLPFQVLSILTMAYNGTQGLGMTISWILNLICIPWICLAFFGHSLDKMDKSFLESLFCQGIFFIASYGIFLFFWKQIIGTFIEIPFLTINFSDWGELEGKCINRGVLFKLISTYNNGNIYGICLCMLLPLYCILESRTFRQWIVKGSLLLTFSRTVWIGWLFYEILFPFWAHSNKSIGIKKLVKIGITLAVIVTTISISYGFKFNFFFDSELGGRKSQLEVLQTASWISSKPFQGISEILYLGILDSFGFLGLCTFLVGMVAPLCLAFPTTLHSKAITFGLLCYLFIACSDGAILYIPVMAFYWSLASLNFAYSERTNFRYSSSNLS